MASAQQDQPQSVRFSDVNQEIEPDEAVQHLAAITDVGKASREGPLSPQAEEELRNLSSTLQKSRYQAKRMEHFSFEPVSLPPSRVSDAAIPYCIAAGAPLTATRPLHPHLPRERLRNIQATAPLSVPTHRRPPLSCTLRH